MGGFNHGINTRKRYCVGLDNVVVFCTLPVVLVQHKVYRRTNVVSSYIGTLLLSIFIQTRSCLNMVREYDIKDGVYICS